MSSTVLRSILVPAVIFVCAAGVLVYGLLRASYFRRRRGVDRPSEPVLYSGPAGVEQALRGGGTWQWVAWVRTTLTVYAGHVEILAPQGTLAGPRDIVLSSRTATMRIDQHGPFGLPLRRRRHIRLVGSDGGGRREEFMLAPKEGFERAWQALIRSGVKPLSPGGGGEYYGAGRQVRLAQGVWTGVWAVGVLAPTGLARWEGHDRLGPLVFALLFLVWIVGAHIVGAVGQRARPRGRVPASGVPFEPTPELTAWHLMGILVFIAEVLYYIALRTG